MTITKDTVGLEAEFFLRGKNGKLLYPGDHGFSTDDFVILGEFRGIKGGTREETLANFMKEWYSVVFKAAKMGHTIDIESGFAEVDPTFYAEILRKVAVKVISQAKNIYPEIDLLKLTDAVVENGVIQKHYLSIGLHIHFGSSVINRKIIEFKDDKYSPVKIPLTFSGSSIAEMNLYQKESSSLKKEEVVSEVSRITKPVLYEFIRRFDSEILKKYVPDLPLKYRNPGFYEIKPWGFEYRSLPFNKLVLDNIAEIVDFSYKLLEELDF